MGFMTLHGSTTVLEQPARDRGENAGRGLPRTVAVPAPKPSPYVNASAGRQDLILFTTQLSIMLDSGVVLSDAITAIAEQMKPCIFRQVVSNLADGIKNGESFSSALSSYPRIFNTMFVSMVKTSEAAGRMPYMLDILSGYLNAEAETRKQVKSAMIYPLIMLLMAVAATGSLMFFVLPRFTRIYESRGAALPKLTQILVSCSSRLADPTFLASLVSLGVLGFIGLSAWKKTTAGQKTIDWVKIHTPVFGTMFIDAVLTRSMRILATMVNTGVSLLDAIDVMRLSCDNYFFRCLWTAVDARLRDGCQLSDAIMLAPYNNLIAGGIIQMLRAGEKSGQIGKVCDKVSIFLEKKLKNSIRAATILIEPLMITLMGGIIGTIAIALLLPVFRISSVMAK
jgi:type IV pilus assembly protein PilC